MYNINNSRGIMMKLFVHLNLASMNNLSENFFFYCERKNKNIITWRKKEEEKQKHHALKQKVAEIHFNHDANYYIAIGQMWQLQQKIKKKKPMFSCSFSMIENIYNLNYHLVICSAYVMRICHVAIFKCTRTVCKINSFWFLIERVFFFSSSLCYYLTF